MDRVELSRRFKALRMKRRWTLDKIALIVGISKGTAWNLENTSKRPQDLTLARLFDSFPELEEGTGGEHGGGRVSGT